ncbi:MAG: hypothetical protein PHX08_08735 [Lachnospiraceae bacterium]|nr:hypothetical protein [Lachnospiraceae bacterium]
MGILKAEIETEEVICMSPAQQLLDYRREIDESQKQVRKMVMESYHDIEAGKGRDCNEFFDELEKRYSNVRV